MDSVFLAGVKALADSFIDGAVEFSASRGEQQIVVHGKTPFDSIPTFLQAYKVFGATKIAILAKPDFTGMWSVSVVSIR
ncbi:MAG: hypothetical protein E6R03_08315 [Hyphomicrobiaceae bacterium]|nr:MAG: hypothetical protein E6R03_08315 [Hyphomicrobiaceae bacterium]